MTLANPSPGRGSLVTELPDEQADIKYFYGKLLKQLKRPYDRSLYTTWQQIKYLGGSISHSKNMVSFTEAIGQGIQDIIMGILQDDFAKMIESLGLDYKIDYATRTITFISNEIEEDDAEYEEIIVDIPDSLYNDLVRYKLRDATADERIESMKRQFGIDDDDDE